MGDPRSFHVLVAKPRFLLVNCHTAAGVMQFCVCHGPDSTRDQAEIQAWWCRSAALIRSASQVSLPLVVLCNANAPVGSVASLGHRRSGGGLGRLNWHGISCLAPGMGHLSASDVPRLAQRPSQAFRNVVFQDALA